MAVRIVGLGGSLARRSTSLAALKVAIEGAAGAGATTELFDVRELNLPMYVPESEPVPDAARALCDAVYACQGMLWSSPLYHGTISGSFKNALDWLQLLGDRRPAYLTDKVVGLISTAGGTQGLQAVNTIEFIVRALRGWAVPLVIPIPQAWRVPAGASAGSGHRRTAPRPRPGGGAGIGTIRLWKDHRSRSGTRRGRAPAPLRCRSARCFVLVTARTQI
jgi:FMN reductase